MKTSTSPPSTRPSGCCVSTCAITSASDAWPGLQRLSSRGCRIKVRGNRTSYYDGLWVIYNSVASCFVVIYDSACLTDCIKAASEHSRESSQQELRDQEDAGDTSAKEEDKHNFMDFPVTEVAEQLTRLDAVGFIEKIVSVSIEWCRKSPKPGRVSILAL